MKRIDTLLATMTIVERIGQLNVVASSRVVTYRIAATANCSRMFDLFDKHPQMLPKLDR
jgi:hypothetical protein